MKVHLYLILLLSLCGLTSIAQTYTFTTAAASGMNGPTQMQVDAAYTATTLDGDVTVIGAGIQEWVVPATANYTITASGASGGNTPMAAGGQGREITIEVLLTAGDVIRVLVGQEGGVAEFSGGVAGGGGGGTFIINQTTGLPILICGGGGGGADGTTGGYQSIAGADAQDYTLTDGSIGLSTPDSWDSPGAGGTGGNGGGGTWGGSGGAGYSGNGTMGGYGGDAGTAYLNGGIGSGNLDYSGVTFIVNTPGGFGGGAGAGVHGNYEANAGGGGGYSGGGGSNTRVGGGGGGGNYYTGTYISSGLNSGHGEAIIAIACASTSITVDNASLSDVTSECPISPTPPTATTSCSIVVDGTPDVTLPVTAQGTTVVTWTYDDGNGHTTTQTQNVIINDVTAPVADAMTLADLTDECSISSLTDPTATDNCSGLVTVTHDAVLPITAQGTTLVTWTYEDENGNTTTQTQNVIITDVTDPVVDAPSLSNVTACFSYAPAAPTATDNCAGTITATPDVTLPVTTAGTTTITWTYDDGNGNTTVQTQDITINTVDVSVTVVNSQIHANGLVAAYQWLDCNNAYAEIAGEMNQHFKPTASGSYAVEVTQNGCTDTSACTTIDYSGVEELENNSFVVYPNPSSDGQFVIQYSGLVSTIEMMDQTGRIIELAVDLANKKIDASPLAAGNYIVRIITENGILVQQVVILN